MDLIKEFWAQIVALSGVLIWATRLEAGMRANAKDIRGIWKQRNEDLESSQKAREDTNKKLDKLDAKMDEAFKEFRSDIKLLLTRSSEK